MSITTKPYGVDLIGRNMTLYTMTNKAGASVSVLDFGATLVSIIVPDKDGKLQEVNLGFDTYQEYDEKPGFLGASVGRYANRIGGAKFTLNGKTYTLFKNDGENTLHGGREGFDKKWWKGQTLESEHEDAVIFTYVSHDGEEGFPGTMKVQITYAFDENNALTIRYMAQCDQDTVVNLTNHSYFNISAKPDIKGLFVQVNSDYITNVDEGLIPTGELLPVDGTLFDLREGDYIGNRLARMDECPLMKAVAGYDTNFVIRGEGLRVAAVVKDPESGRVMTVKTTEPAMQIYTANSMDNIGHSGAHYGNYAGIALETQHYPDSPNHPEFPTTTLKAGDTFQSTTIYAFSVEK